ncbi:hypothetical protein KSP40_PGU009087 [Platanthera guangdongensis]|uniref:Uncharacterized protein n=1 Tax=Platanthera guangdongensis TaxID=2320717 RepID=A0ABR2M7F0_9ASPA
MVLAQHTPGTPLEHPQIDLRYNPNSARVHYSRFRFGAAKPPSFRRCSFAVACRPPGTIGANNPVHKWCKRLQNFPSISLANTVWPPHQERRNFPQIYQIAQFLLSSPRALLSCSTLIHRLSATTTQICRPGGIEAIVLECRHDRFIISLLCYLF